MSRLSDLLVDGYTLSHDNLLVALRNEEGYIVNPDLILAANVLCKKCQYVLSEAEHQYYRGSIPADTDVHKFESVHDDGDCVTGTAMASVISYRSESDMRRSGQSGCIICARLLFTSRQECLDRSRCSPYGSGFLSIEVVSPVELNLYQSFPHEPLGEYRWLPLGKYNGEYDYPEMDISVDQSASNASKGCFKLASSWLKECIEGHQNCRQKRLNVFPKRLIYVGEENCRDVSIVDTDERCPYLTVSHCWGENPPPHLKLTKTNLNTLQKQTPDKLLPCLVRDCVIVTRRLGYQYLWIDTMCIIQDDDEDKEEEIKKMGDIYAGSICNIAAVSAENSLDSIFSKAVPNRAGRSNLQSKTSAIEYVIGGEWPIAQEPLYGRGWVIQERILAPRVIEYTDQGLRWYCRESTYGWHIDHFSPEWRQLLALSKSRLSENDKISGQSMWMKIVEQYSLSAFSRDAEDRQHALLGVISVLNANTGLEMCNGLCVDYLPYSLLWKMFEPRDLNQRSQRYESPSWSSTFRNDCTMQRPIMAQTGNINKHYSECSINPTTAVLSVTSRCHRSMKIRRDCSNDSESYLCDQFQLQKKDGSWDKFRLCPYPGVSYSFILELDYLSLEPTEVDLVALISIPKPDNDGFHGLVLSKVPCTENWERVGIFCSWLNDHEIMQCFPDQRTYTII